MSVFNVRMGLLSVILASIGMIGCAGTSAAYKAADGLSDTAYVVGEHYYALVRSANKLREAGNLEARELMKIQEIAQETRPAIVAMLDAGSAYKQVRSAENQQELTDALTVAAIAVSKLVDAIKNVGGSVHLIIGPGEYAPLQVIPLPTLHRSYDNAS